MLLTRDVQLERHSNLITQFMVIRNIGIFHWDILPFFSQTMVVFGPEVKTSLNGERTLEASEFPKPFLFGVFEK